MEKYFVTYDQALELLEIGYDEYSWFGQECSLYKPSGEHTFYANGIGKDYISAPLKSQVSNWFRDKHNLIFHTEFSGDGYYWSGLWIEGDQKFRYFTRSESFYESESMFMNKLIELVKNRK